MTQIQFDKMSHTAQWLVIEAITNKYPDVRQHTECHPDKDGNLDIKFSVNGIELPFLEVIDAIDEQLDRHINGKAEQLIEEKWADKKEEIMELIFGKKED